MIVNNFLKTDKLKKDKNGIWVTKDNFSKETFSSQKTWEKIYDFNMNKLKKDRKDFEENKLEDHIKYILNSYKFNPKTVYLEIGCGPSYIGEYLLNHYKCTFIGVDFNYQMLVTVKKYFDNLGYKNTIFIHADIKKMPIKNNTIDFTYGGGVIEHFTNTKSILKELHRVTKAGGVTFNTVPAFNFFWPVSMKKNIPSYPLLKQLFGFIHIKILKNKLLEKYHGYELSFGINQLKKLHKKIGYSSIKGGAFAFHPSSAKLRNKFLRESYFNLSKISLFSPIIYIAAKK